MATIRGAGAQHLVVSYSGPSVAADCTVSQPGGPPSMTLASHSRVNHEPAIIQWACIELHSNWKPLWGKGDDGGDVVIKTCSAEDPRQRAHIIKMNLGEGTEPLAFVAQVRYTALIGSSGARNMSTVHPADYNGPFYGWTKTDGGAGSAIHPSRRVMVQGGEGRETGFCQSRQIQKQVGVAGAALAISDLHNAPHSKAPWLGDLRVNNVH